MGLIISCIGQDESHDVVTAGQLHCIIPKRPSSEGVLSFVKGFNLSKVLFSEKKS